MLGPMPPISSLRPHVTVVFAISADGKIGDDQRSRARFGTQADRRHLEEQVAKADGVLMGAGTLRSEGTAMRVFDQALVERRQQQGLPPQPAQIIASPSGNISPDLKFFNQNCPHWLLTLPDNVERWRSQPGFDQVRSFAITQRPENASDPDAPSNFPTIDWPSTLGKLKEDGIHRLAVLGGGTVVAALLAIDAIDEWHLTVCPLIVGGRNAPTPVDGETGLPADQALRFDLESATTVGHEVFLHYVRTGSEDAH